MVDVPPGGTVVGKADKASVGGGTTVTVTLCVPDDPSVPLQAPEKIVVVLSAAEDWDPDVPVCHGDPAIEMEHVVAFVEDQVMVDMPPGMTVVGEADKARVAGIEHIVPESVNPVGHV